jgi:hypothetical protein
MPTTTKDIDYLGRDLTNPDPGVSSATDYLGRSVGPNNTDFLGRSLLETGNLPAEFPFEFGEDH